MENQAVVITVPDVHRIVDFLDEQVRLVVIEIICDCLLSWRKGFETPYDTGVKKIFLN